MWHFKLPEQKSILYLCNFQETCMFIACKYQFTLELYFIRTNFLIHNSAQILNIYVDNNDLLQI